MGGWDTGTHPYVVRRGDLPHATACAPATRRMQARPPPHTSLTLPLQGARRAGGVCTWNASTWRWRERKTMGSWMACGAPGTRTPRARGTSICRRGTESRPTRSHECPPHARSYQCHPTQPTGCTSWPRGWLGRFFGPANLIAHNCGPSTHGSIC